MSFDTESPSERGKTQQNYQAGYLCEERRHNAGNWSEKGLTGSSSSLVSIIPGDNDSLNRPETDAHVSGGVMGTMRPKASSEVSAKARCWGRVSGAGVHAAAQQMASRLWLLYLAGSDRSLWTEWNPPSDRGRSLKRFAPKAPRARDNWSPLLLGRAYKLCLTQCRTTR